MDFKDFAIGVVGETARAALDASPPDAPQAAHHAGLLADMLAAAAAAVETDEWLCVWSCGAMPLYCHRGLEAYCRDRLGRAALAFVKVQGERVGEAAAGAQAVVDLLAILHADPNYTPFVSKAVLALQIDLLCKCPVSSFPDAHPAALLKQVFDAEDEDWVSEQLSKLHEARHDLPLPSGDNAEVAKIWKSLSKRGGGAAGAGASAMRLSSIYGAHNISEEFIQDGLTHRTRATRRLTVELLKQQQGEAPWWGTWHSAFIVVSDEQPWHIVQPVWQDVTELGGLFTGAVPARWASVLIQRAAAHSDHRVVRHTTADAVKHSESLDAAVVLDIIPAALGVRGTLEGLATPLAAAALDIIIDQLPAPSASTAAAVEHIAGAVFEEAAADPARVSDILAKVARILTNWRRSGGAEAILVTLGACALRGAILHALPHAAFVDVGSIATALPPRALVAALQDCGASEAARAAYVDAAFSHTPSVFAHDDAVVADLVSAFYAQVHAETFARRIRPATPAAFCPTAFAAAVAAAEAAVEAGQPNTVRECGPGAAAVSVWGLQFPAEAVAAGVWNRDRAACTFLALAAQCPSLANAAAARGAAELRGQDPDHALAVCLSIPDSVWAEHPDPTVQAAVLAWCCDASVPVTYNTMHRLRLAATAVTAIVPALPDAERTDALLKVVSWLRGAALVHFGAAPEGGPAPAPAPTPPAEEAAAGGKKKKKKLTRKTAKGVAVVPGVVELMQVVEGCCAALDDAVPVQKRLMRDLVETAWSVVKAYPAKFSGSRTMYGAFFRAAVRREEVLDGLDGLLSDLIPASSLVASQFTRAAWGTVGDSSADLLAYLALHAPAPKACALDAQHPAALLARPVHPELGEAGRKVTGSALASAVIKHVLRDETPEGHDGSAAQLRRVRQWWLLVALLPQVDAATAEVVANAAVVELRHSRVVPKTRVLVQNAWAIACALHPDTNTTLPLLVNTLAAPATETRFAVSAIIVAAHLLVGGAAAEGGDLLTAAWREKLLGVVVGWSLAMPHAARTHAQLVLAEYLDIVASRDDAPPSGAAEASLLGALRTFLASNPHLSALRSAAGLSKLVSVYLVPSAREGALATALPPFLAQSVEMKVLKALRLVQARFSELDGEATDRASAPAAGWASKGSRKCPARARGSGYNASGEGDGDGGSDDEGGDVSEEDGALVDPTHQRRPTPGRPFKSARPKICVVGSFLDNLPNQAGLCRTTEALFGPYAEVTLASLKCTTEPAFLRMSMASERWLKLLEVPPGERLAAYLTQKRLEGYRIVALEQTDSSVPAQAYQFHSDTVLIIGNEQLGCPAWLLRRPELVHDFVELPLDGASRSLNAHVTASAMVWQFRLQTY